jgi:SPP1 family predicted phage head-tail adaptor
MKAGDLRQRIALQAQTEVQSPQGDVTLTWANLYVDVPAAFLPAKGREIVVGDGLRHELPAKFVIRWLPGVTTAQRVLWDGQTWLVEDVMPDPTGRKQLTLSVVRDG